MSSFTESFFHWYFINMKIIYPSVESLKNKHILAIDYGRKFTGVSTYKVGIDPYPLGWGRIAYVDDKQLQQELFQIIEDEFIDVLVVGVPYFTDGTESKLTKEIKAFINILKNDFSIDVYEVDETLTTFEAEERMKNDPAFNFQVDLTKIDMVCAKIILEEFLKYSSDQN